MHSLLVLLAFVDFWPESSSDDFIAKTQPVVKSQQVQVLFLTASWCGPCQQFKSTEIPRLIEKGWSVDGRESSLIRVIDVDEHPELAARFTPSSLPCFIRVVDGKESRLSGFQPAGEITDLFYGRVAQLPVIVTQVAEQVQQPAQQVQQVQQQQWSLVPIRRRRFLFWEWSE
jgi:thioredoxin-like negative regulator of GroEL